MLIIQTIINKKQEQCLDAVINPTSKLIASSPIAYQPRVFVCIFQERLLFIADAFVSLPSASVGCAVGSNRSGQAAGPFTTVLAFGQP